MSKIIHVNQQSFQSAVLESPIPVVVDFHANWCPPCRALSPILDRLSEEFAGQIRFVKINSDEEPALAQLYKVTGLPTVVFIDDGITAGQFAGLPQERALREQLREWVASKGVTSQ